MSIGGGKKGFGDPGRPRAGTIVYVDFIVVGERLVLRAADDIERRKRLIRGSQAQQGQIGGLVITYDADYRDTPGDTFATAAHLVDSEQRTVAAQHNTIGVNQDSRQGPCELSLLVEKIEGRKGVVNLDLLRRRLGS